MCVNDQVVIYYRSSPHPQESKSRGFSHRSVKSMWASSVFNWLITFSTVLRLTSNSSANLSAWRKLYRSIILIRYENTIILLLYFFRIVNAYLSVFLPPSITPLFESRERERRFIRDQFRSYQSYKYCVLLIWRFVRGPWAPDFVIHIRIQHAELTFCKQYCFFVHWRFFNKFALSFNLSNEFTLTIKL
jgi:hypothetical protein